MIGEWLGSVAVAGFFTGAASMLVPKDKSRISVAVKLISAIILITVTLLPIFKLAGSDGEKLGALIAPAAEAETSPENDLSGFVTDAAVNNVEAVLKGSLASELGREDFDIVIDWNDEGEDILVTNIKVYYEKGTDFPAAYVARRLQERLNTEVELCERNE